MSGMDLLVCQVLSLYICKSNVFLYSINALIISPSFSEHKFEGDGNEIVIRGVWMFYKFRFLIWAHITTMCTCYSDYPDEC